MSFLLVKYVFLQENRGNPSEEVKYTCIGQVGVDWNHATWNKDLRRTVVNIIKKNQHLKKSGIS
jgi:hypothetical protein